MWKVTKALAVVMVLSCGPTWAHAQKATEQYIPIGRSPGVSHKLTNIGNIVAVDAQGRTITVANSTGPQIVSITPGTKIWLDRSTIKRTNLVGNFADLREGRKVEVKFAPSKDGPSAEWVKVQITAP